MEQQNFQGYALAALVLVTFAMNGCQSLSERAISTTTLPSGAAIASTCSGEIVEEGFATSRAVDGAQLDYIVRRPVVHDGRLPVIFWMHGYGDSKAADYWNPDQFVDSCYLSVAMTIRGHGNSDGEIVSVGSRDLELPDALGLVDHIVSEYSDLIAFEDEAMTDPLLGGAGYSYGGALQWASALYEMFITDSNPDDGVLDGHTRWDAIAPAGTWYDIHAALGPNDVPRSYWLSLQLALAASGAARFSSTTNQSVAYTLATGYYDDGDTPFGSTEGIAPGLATVFEQSDPASFVSPDTARRAQADRYQLDIPVFVQQGFTDTFMTLNQSMAHWQNSLTPEARAKSVLRGFNGGHFFTPHVYPAGNNPQYVAGDYLATNCAENSEYGGLFDDLSRFFDRALKGQGAPQELFGDGNQTVVETQQGECRVLPDGLKFAQPVAGEAFQFVPEAVPLTVIAGSGASLNLPILSVEANAPDFGAGKIVAGAPHLRVTITADLDTRLFLGISQGKTPADAILVQNGLTPLNVELATGASRELIQVFDLEMVALATEVADGESLFLHISTQTDQFPLVASRVPSPVLIHSADLWLPVNNNARPWIPN